MQYNTRVRGFEKVEYRFFRDKCDEFFPQSIYEKIVEPERATVGSAGYDFFAPYGFTLSPGEDITIPTGIKAYMLVDEMLDIRPRSGQGFKYLRIANTTGVIDSDYYDNAETGGQIVLKLRNETNDSRGIIEVKAGKGFAQGIFMKYLLVDGDNYLTGKTREGGFGSTG